MFDACPLENDIGIKFLGDIKLFFNQNLLYFISLDVHSQDSLSCRFSLIRSVGKLHRTGFPPAPCSNLGLDHKRSGQFLSRLSGIFLIFKKLCHLAAITLS